MSTILAVLIGAGMSALLDFHPWRRRQVDRIPAWIRQALWSGMLLGCVVTSYAHGSPYMGGFCAFLFGLDIEQFFGGRQFAAMRNVADQYRSMYAELHAHSMQQHEALIEAQALLEPAARIVAEEQARKVGS